MWEPDGVVGPHTDPVGDGPVLPHLLGELLLDPERLVGRLHIQTNQISKSSSFNVSIIRSLQ